MRSLSILKQQRGTTLLVSMIMMLLFTVMVSGSFTLSTSNQKAVGNMQVKEEALAAANSVLEQVISSNFTAAPAAQDLDVDINNDDTPDYVVSIAAPTCIRATQASTASLSSATLSAMSSQSTWNTVWNLTAIVNDPASGASATIRSGVRVLLTQSEKNAVCP